MTFQIPIRTYAGPNEAHTKFSHQYRYLNALYYLVVSNKEALTSNLKSVSKAPDSIIGVVTHPISNKQFQGVFVPANDARDMANNFSIFLSVLQKQTITASYRTLADYLIDQLIELRDKAGLSFDSKLSTRLKERFMTINHIVDAYNQIEFELYIEGADRTRMQHLIATRNVIEHNNSKVSNEYIQLTGSQTLKVGDLAPTGPREVGEALSLTEHIAQSTNLRVLNKWPEVAI